jgi:protein-L-isoaspartate(D-aspartate) O-methyltransferase
MRSHLRVAEALFDAIEAEVHEITITPSETGEAMEKTDPARLAACREFYAKLVAVAGGPLRDRLEHAFGMVRRENFLGPGPWLARSIYDATYVQTPTDDPIHLYQNLLFALRDEKGINNGEPCLHGQLLGALNPREGDTVLHVGCGTGYYTAVLAQLVGSTGKVIGYEVDAELAARAVDNLAPWRSVEVRCASGVIDALPRCDAIYVNAGATRPAAAWLDALNDDGRLVFPLSGTSASGTGVSLLITRRKQAFAAAVIGFCLFISCQDAFDQDEASNVTAAFRSGALWATQSLVRNDRSDETAVLVGNGWWLSSVPPKRP